MERKKKLRIALELAMLPLTAVLLYAWMFWYGCRLMPERTTYGAVWSSYLQERENSVDVLFLGSSRAYCNVSPARIYEDTGISSYLMAGPSQTVSLTYYYLRECLRTQSPKYVFVEVSGAYYGLYEEYSMVNVCYMPASINRLLAARTCEEGITELALYPLQEFHYRVYEKDRDAPPERDGRLLCGFTPMLVSRAQTERSLRKPGVRPGDERYLYNLGWLQRIAELCEEEGIACVFYLAPTMQPYSDEDTGRLFADLRALPCAAAENWQDLNTELGIDNAADWYDAIHFNCAGAQKFSDYLADYLLALGAGPTQDPDEALWAERIAYLRPMQVEPAENGT